MYYNGRGLGEFIRYIFLAADVPFEDFRWEESEWPLYKPKMPLGCLNDIFLRSNF